MGCGDVRLLRTIRSVDFTGQERAALNKLTMPVGRFQAANVLPPAVDRLAADTVLLRHVRDRLRVGLPEDRDPLLFCESGLLHGSLTSRGRHSLKRQLARKSPSRSGSQGDAFDNALAESVIGLYKTEVIRRRGPWRTLEAVEFATLEWMDWFNMRRLLEPIGDVPPAECEAQYYEQAKVA